jgi:small subunit ribosomal protein S9
VCRIYLTPGTGKWEVNGRALGEFFPRPTLVSSIQQPFAATDTPVSSTCARSSTAAVCPVRPARCASPSARALVKIDEANKQEAAPASASSRVMRARSSARSPAARRPQAFQFSKR